MGCEWTNLDGAIRCGRAARCPFQGGVKGGDIEDGESSQLFFGVSIRTVLDATLSILSCYRGSSFRRSERIASHISTRLFKSFVVGTPGTGVRVGSVAIP